MLPKYLQPFLWSYEIAKLDPERHKKRIITNLLNFGDTQAIHWLFKTYNRPEIKVAVVDFLPGEWNKKSLNFWRLFFNIKKSKIQEDKRIIE
ncbi:MAG: hypothetical protein U9Q72_01680 [Patescibacteria group bacterium]|nr:hypothetical protein [Patescibacteria group bacterium]